MTWVPQACTLPTAERPLRVAEFDALFAAALGPANRMARDRLRLHVADDPGVAATVADLIARETACCSFFHFDVTSWHGELCIDVQVPQPQVAVLDAVQRRAEAARTRAAAAP